MFPLFFVLEIFSFEDRLRFCTNKKIVVFYDCLHQRKKPHSYVFELILRLTLTLSFWTRHFLIVDT